MAKTSAVFANASSPNAALNTTDLSKVTSDSKVEGLVHSLAEIYGELNTIIEAEARELFCVCQKVDADCGGDMIECSNGDQCKDRWFHFKCIGMAQIPGEKDDWFCDYCVMRFWGGAGQWYDTLQSLKSKPSTFDTVPASADLGLAMCESGLNSKSNPVVMDRDGVNLGAVSSSTLTTHSRSSGIESRLSLAHLDVSPQPSRKPWKKSELARLSKEISHMVANDQTGTVDSWDLVAERLREHGIFRTGNGCKIAWTRHLTDQSKRDRRTKNRAGRNVQDGLNKNRKEMAH